jgi:hypothetical protein
VAFSLLTNIKQIVFQEQKEIYFFAKDMLKTNKDGWPKQLRHYHIKGVVALRNLLLRVGFRG